MCTNEVVHIVIGPERQNEHKIGAGHWHHHQCQRLGNIAIISIIARIIIIIIPLACYHFSLSAPS